MLCTLHLPTVLLETEVWLSQHSNQAFTLDFRLCKLNHMCQMQLHLTEVLPSHQRERDSSPRTPLTVTALSIVSLHLCRPHRIPKGSSCRHL